MLTAGISLHCSWNNTLSYTTATYSHSLLLDCGKADSGTSFSVGSTSTANLSRCMLKLLKGELVTYLEYYNRNLLESSNTNEINSENTRLATEG